MDSVYVWHKYGGQKKSKSRRTGFSVNITLNLCKNVFISAKILLFVPFEKHAELRRRQFLNAISLSAFRVST